MKLIAKVDRQMFFISEASQEPLLWRRRFPQASYEKIVQHQYEVLRSLFLCDVLMATAGAKAEKHFTTFVRPLYDMLDQLEGELILALSRLALFSNPENNEEDEG